MTMKNCVLSRNSRLGLGPLTGFLSWHHLQGSLTSPRALFFGTRKRSGVLPSMCQDTIKTTGESLDCVLVKTPSFYKDPWLKSQHNKIVLLTNLGCTARWKCWDARTWCTWVAPLIYAIRIHSPFVKSAEYGAQVLKQGLIFWTWQAFCHHSQ